MGLLRNRVTAASCAFAAAGLTVGGCSDSGTTSAAVQATAAASSTPGPCASTYLAMTLGHHSGTTTVTQAVNLTNNGTSACVLDGYPGVNLVGVAHGVSQYTWTLQWATARHSPVTLEPGGSAHFYVVYVPAGSKAVGGKATATPTVAPTGATSAKASVKASASPKVSAKATSKAGTKPASTAKASVAPSKSVATASPVVDIEVLDISITLPNTYSQDEAAWNAHLVLQDKVAHAQTYVTPFVPGTA